MTHEERNGLVEALAALKRADQFIANGRELGFIRMPDTSTPDSAHETPGLIRAAIAKLSAALQAPQESGVRVKALEWRENRQYCGDCSVETIVGTYEVGFDDGWWAQLDDGVKWDWEPEFDRRSYSGPEAAKAAAQADFDRRIRSALSQPEAQAVPEGWKPINVAPRDGRWVWLWNKHADSGYEAQRFRWSTDYSVFGLGGCWTDGYGSTMGDGVDFDFWRETLPADFVPPASPATGGA